MLCNQSGDAWHFDISLGNYENYQITDKAIYRVGVRVGVTWQLGVVDRGLWNPVYIWVIVIE